jgi:hypothetical protein
MIRFKTIDTTLSALIIFNLLVLTILSLAGCGGGSGNIPVASVLSSGRLTLSWKDVPGAASYDLYISTSPGVTTLNSYKIADVTTPLTITDLEPGTTYYFMVAVLSDSGESRKSKEVSYTIAGTEGFIEFGDIIGQSELEGNPPQPAETPVSSSVAEQAAVKQSEPQVLVAPGDKAGLETRDVTLAWDNVANATSYNVYWSDKPGVTRQNGTKIANAKNPCKLKGLKKGKKYYFVVTAVNQAGESKESEEFSFTVGQ